MKVSSFSKAFLFLTNSLLLSSLPTTVLASKDDDIEAHDGVSKMLRQQQQQKQQQDQDERKLLFNCETICLFWCACHGYTCSTKGDTDPERRKMMMEMVGLDPDTTDLDLLSDEELSELELKAHTTLVDDSYHEHHRALLFGLFGKCQTPAPTPRPTPRPTPAPVAPSATYVRRYLSNERETADTIPKNPEHALQLINEIGGDPEATYSYQHNIIDKDEADRIIDYMESHHKKDYQTKEFNTNDPSDAYEFYIIDMTGTEFVPLIGKKRMQELVNLMQTRATPDHPYLPITRIRGFYLPPDPNKHLGYHLDEFKVTLIIELSEGVEGGEIVYLNGKDGAILHPRTVGSAFVHGSDIVHGVTSHEGKGRYVLYILSDRNLEADPALTEEALSMA